MRPRQPSCDGDDCPDLPAGQHRDCTATDGQDGAEDIAWSTAMEDGYARRPAA